MTAPRLQVKDLSVHFDVRGTSGKKAVLQAVNGVSFDIPAGETLGLVGESGSGKSTTGNGMLRLVPWHAGEVRLDGKDIGQLKGRELRGVRKRMQIVFQDPYSSLDPSMTIGQLLEEPLIVHEKLSGKDRLDRIVQALRAVRLTSDYISRYPHEFSGGQRQRIAIARSMILDPEVVVFDEPVSALDVSTQSQIVNLILKLQQDLGTSILFIAHDLAVVRIVSHNTAVMYLGEMVEVGPSARVYDQPAHPYTAALNSAIPLPDPAKQRSRKRLILSGEQPSPMDPPSGCRFRTRCPFVMDVCAEQVPPHHPVEGGGTAACHLHDHGPKLRGGSVLPLVKEGVSSSPE